MQGRDAEREAQLLTTNLAALERRDPDLAERVRAPVDAGLVEWSPRGEAQYRLHGARLALSAPEPAPSEVGRGATDVLLFGLGLGESLRAALQEASLTRIVAWERDPWLLRQALSRVDASAALQEGRLVLALGSDLLDHLPIGPRGPGQAPRAVWMHPLLARVYEWERSWLEGAAATSRPRAVVALGGLFVDDLARALDEAGFAVVPVDLRRWSILEIEHTLTRARPALLAAINYIPGLAELAGRARTPLLCWEIDPSTDVLAAPQGDATKAWLFTWRRAHVEPYRMLGFEHVEHAPLASDVSRRRPPAEPAPDLESVAVAFVGSSMVAEGQAQRRRFLELHARHVGGDAARAESGRRALDRALAEQRAAGGRYVLPELLERDFGEFLAAERARPGADDPLLLAAELAAAQRRMDVLAALGRCGLHVWGDGEFARLAAHGVVYRGPAGHRDELTRIFGHARILVDVGRLYQADIVTMRVFDVLACGGFLIAEDSAELPDCFERGVELETWSTIEELVRKVEHYLAHPEEARAIAARGLAAVRQRHDLRERVRGMLRRMGVRSEA